MKRLLFIWIICIPLYSCSKNPSTIKNQQTYQIINKSGTTLKERFNPPQNYERVNLDKNSFGEYLRNIKLKPYGSLVHFYNNKVKENYGIYVSVIDMNLDKQDLQQCADAVMRLRGEYLYSQKEYNQIHFNTLSDNKPKYFLNYTNGKNTYSDFRSYMRYIFSYANTTSLYNELIPVKNINDIRPGDVFIQKRRPYGHAVIVMDVAVNPKTGKKVYLLAQSYMPAQDTQILENPNNKDISPWYEVNNLEINTPQWTFEPKDLRRFGE